jgi:MoaF-like
LTLIIGLGLAILALLPAVGAQEGASQQTQLHSMNFVGRKFHFHYASGLEVKGHYRTASELSWEVLSGPEKGSSGAEKIYAQEVAPNVFFVSWLEKSGTSVSQVLDLNKLQVVAFVTFDAGSGRQSMFDKGTLTEVKSSAHSD